MILRRVLAAAAAAGAALAAAAALVVAAVYALYALLKEPLGQAGASGAVALTIAVLFGIAFMVLSSKAKGGKAHRPKMKHEADAPPVSGLDRILGLARERPIVAAAGAVAAGLLALRNPAMVALVMRAFTEPRRGPQA